jgi:hypothetical protein
MTTPTPLAQAVGDLDEQTAVGLVQEKLTAGETALSILEELQAGMNVVGERFEGGESTTSPSSSTRPTSSRRPASPYRRNSRPRSRRSWAPWSWAP